jgi:hypothetical protein
MVATMEPGVAMHRVELCRLAPDDNAGDLQLWNGNDASGRRGLRIADVGPAA